MPAAALNLHLPRARGQKFCGSRRDEKLHFRLLPASASDNP